MWGLTCVFYLGVHCMSAPCVDALWGGTAWRGAWGSFFDDVLILFETLRRHSPHFSPSTTRRMFACFSFSAQVHTLPRVLFHTSC